MSRNLLNVGRGKIVDLFGNRLVISIVQDRVTFPMRSGIGRLYRDDLSDL